jgi:hypothetical protein
MRRWVREGGWLWRGTSSCFSLLQQVHLVLELPALIGQSAVFHRFPRITAYLELVGHLLVGVQIRVDAMLELGPWNQERAAQAQHPVGTSDAQTSTPALAEDDRVVCVPAFEDLAWVLLHRRGVVRGGQCEARRTPRLIVSPSSDPVHSTLWRTLRLQPRTDDPTRMQECRGACPIITGSALLLRGLFVASATTPLSPKQMRGRPGLWSRRRQASTDVSRTMT